MFMLLFVLFKKFLLLPCVRPVVLFVAPIGYQKGMAEEYQLGSKLEA